MRKTSDISDLFSQFIVSMDPSNDEVRLLLLAIAILDHNREFHLDVVRYVGTTDALEHPFFERFFKSLGPHDQARVLESPLGKRIPRDRFVNYFESVLENTNDIRTHNLLGSAFFDFFRRRNDHTQPPESLTDILINASDPYPQCNGIKLAFFDRQYFIKSPDVLAAKSRNPYEPVRLTLIWAFLWYIQKKRATDSRDDIEALRIIMESITRDMLQNQSRQIRIMYEQLVEATEHILATPN